MINIMLTLLQGKTEHAMMKMYYNPDIKRFINQDILTGSLSNSQSLNQYSYVQGNPVSYTDPFGLSPVNGLFSDTNFAHSLLGLLSCIPGFVGSTASAIDGLVYAVVDKDYSMTALCFMDALSFGIGKAGSKLLKAKKYTNTAETLINASHLMSNAASFGMCADAMMATGFSMYDKYYIQGQSADSSTKWEVLSLGMSALGCVISGRGISKSTKSMSNMLQQEGFTNALKGEVMEMAGRAQKTSAIVESSGSGIPMNLQFFGRAEKQNQGTLIKGTSIYGDRSYYSRGKLIIEGVDPSTLKVGEQQALDPSRLNRQRELIENNIERNTLIKVTKEGVIEDGHHGARAAAEVGKYVDVEVVSGSISSTNTPILRMKIRGRLDIKDVIKSILGR